VCVVVLGGTRKREKNGNETSLREHTIADRLTVIVRYELLGGGAGGGHGGGGVGRRGDQNCCKKKKHKAGGGGSQSKWVA